MAWIQHEADSNRRTKFIDGKCKNVNIQDNLNSPRRPMANKIMNL